LVIAVDAVLVRRLVDTQFPQWAELPLRPVDPAGSDHVIYQLGEDLAVGIPRHAGAIGQAAKELEWLPRLAPLLPLATPVPVAVGQPDFGGLGMGDPARDLMMAYTLMSPRSRAAFRAALNIDDDTWTRGRGWGLATGLNAYTSYAAVNPLVATRTTRQITQAIIG
jgi:aminoglycoside phosphotransferase (APT) family kinase protein